MDEVREAAELRLGRSFGRKYKLTRLLGIGGTAAVYEAEHRNGNRVAIKVLHARLSAYERQRKRFLREAYVANTIAHPGAVRIHDDGIAQNGDAFLVMELLDGESIAALQARAPDRKLAPDLVLDLATQLLDALDAAHARGVVHRDIKPENLFWTTGGRLKVLDFGIARSFEHVPGTTVDTEDGTTMGTPAYMCQEQARGRWHEVDARSDIWAVGATLFTLLTGEFVHEGGTPNEQLGRAMTQPARSLGELISDLPSHVAFAIDRALCFERSGRWPDARSMRIALQGLSAATTQPEVARPPAITTLTRSLPAARGFDRKRALRASAVCLLVLGVAAWAWAARNDGAPEPAAPPRMATAPKLRTTALPPRVRDFKEAVPELVQAGVQLAEPRAQARNENAPGRAPQRDGAARRSTHTPPRRSPAGPDPLDQRY